MLGSCYCFEEMKKGKKYMVFGFASKIILRKLHLDLSLRKFVVFENARTHLAFSATLAIHIVAIIASMVTIIA